MLSDRDDPDIDETTRLRNRIAELESFVRELRGTSIPFHFFQIVEASKSYRSWSLFSFHSHCLTCQANHILPGRIQTTTTATPAISGIHDPGSAEGLQLQLSPSNAANFLLSQAHRWSKHSPWQTYSIRTATTVFPRRLHLLLQVLLMP